MSSNQSRWERIRSLLFPVTKLDLKLLEKRIMSAISDYASAVQSVFDDLGTQVDSMVTSQEGIAKDVASLKATIEKLQNTPGSITPEDQALLDSIQTQAASLQTKLTTVSEALKALDAATEEAPPTQPVGPS